jgi:hypothetical protein
MVDKNTGSFIKKTGDCTAQSPVLETIDENYRLLNNITIKALTLITLYNCEM